MQILHGDYEVFSPHQHYVFSFIDQCTLYNCIVKGTTILFIHHNRLCESKSGYSNASSVIYIYISFDGMDSK